MSSAGIPSEAKVKEVLLRITSPQLRRAFFEGLRNPDWVRPLADAGVFDNPPEPETMPDGLVRDVYWPELSYLVRVAADAPHDVVDVFLKLGSSKNAWVRGSVFEVGARVSAAEGVRLKPLLEAWRNSGFGWRTDPREIVSFAVRLLEGGETETGLWLADVLFRPRRAETEDALARPRLELEDYWYEVELPRIVRALGDVGLSRASAWLAEYMRLSGFLYDEHDASGIVRANVGERDKFYSSPEQALIDTVRDLALAQLPRDPNGTVDILLAPGVELLRKIAFFVVAEDLRRRIEEGSDPTGLIGVAERLLGDDAPATMYLRVEFAELARAVAVVSRDSVSVLQCSIASIHSHDLKRIRERMSEEADSGSDLEDRILAEADSYKHNWLSAIGSEALPAGLRTELAKLDATFGEIADPLVRMGQITTWSGPNPYSTKDEMGQMTPTELISHLNSWHDTGDGWGTEPSHEGQGRELSALLTSNPLALSGATEETLRLRPTYLRAILEGWESALKAGLELDWPQVADMIRHVLRHDEVSPFPVEGGDMDDDPDFRWAKKAAVGLLEELVKKRHATTVPEEHMPSFATLLIDDAKDDLAWLEYQEFEGGGNGWDPLTVSLNWRWPNRLRGLLYLATRSLDAPWKQSAFAAIEAELERDDKHGAGRAVVGENLARIHNDSPGWLRARLQELFGGRDSISVSQQIALTTSIATHNYHRTLYELLSDSMIAALEVRDGLVAGWRSDSDPVKRIGEWVVTARILGHTDAYDPLTQAFYTRTSPDVRGKAIGAIAWSLFRAQQVDDAIRDRLAELWDERVNHVRDHLEDSAELREFYWFAKGEKFATSWWLPRMKAALDLEPMIASERCMIGKELAMASKDDPENALAVLNLILGERDTAGLVTHDLTRNAVPVVIANALLSEDLDLQGTATELMNRLGMQGHFRLEAEVNALMSGAIVEDDPED